MANKVENKTVLLLSPQQLLKNTDILQILHIRKSATDVKYENIDLDSHQINRTYPTLPNDVKIILASFSAANADARNSNIRSRYKTGRAGIAPLQLSLNGIIKYGQTEQVPKQQPVRLVPINHNCILKL